TSLNLSINQDLLALPGAQLENITEVLSHEQALRQCEGILEGINHKMKRTICENTAAAAKRVAESSRMDVAAIAGAQAAYEYGLDVLAQHIQDQKDNFTRFVLIAKQPVIQPNATTSAFQLVIPHEPGALFRVLSRFASIGVNMTKLESRPIPGKPFEFMFYIDIESVPTDARFDVVVQQIPPLCDEVVYMGTYTDLGFIES
ncbi:MAG: bifunctional chorismate mutase/prephenate dehydratase, partial [Eggerthellaceae bacterium]|nr:bifunctional chorismate mutase/prephenate dehydratase [Eggerthellaceae bacterium]